MASKYPDVVSFKSITAKAVVVGLLEIFCRPALPLQLLSDRGAQFVGKVVTQLSKLLNITTLHTTAYHPQANGAVGCMHGTLEAMLSKAYTEALDWVGQVPLALFALRQAAARGTGLSPYELAYGRQARTPLDLLYVGWKEEELGRYKVCEWVDSLAERMEVMRDVAYEKLTRAVKRKEIYDKERGNLKDT